MEVEPRLRDELERLVPLDDEGRDWGAVLQRVVPPHSSRTRRTGWAMALAAAVVVAAGLALSPVGGAVARTGGAVARTVGGFSAWLRGEPGEPVSDEEQREFEAESRSWNAFPETPKLRRLLRQDVGGTRYELFGFRIGESLCLRLVAGDGGEEPATSCAPLRDLRTTTAPALVVLADHPFGTGPLPRDALPGEYPPVRARATFGIVADGVDEVELEGDQDRHHALVGSNAFLYVAPKPPARARVREAFARDAAGVRRHVPLASAPFGVMDFQTGENGEPGGPLMPQRCVGRTTIGWLERRELRGQSVEEAAPERARGARDPRLIFARVLRPDPNSFARVEVGLVDWSASGPTPAPPTVSPNRLTLCWGALPMTPGSYGCLPFEGFFEPAYVVRATLRTSGGNQYATVVGLAGDVVDRIELFLATGERLAVPFATTPSTRRSPARSSRCALSGTTVRAPSSRRRSSGSQRARVPPGKSASCSSRKAVTRRRCCALRHRRTAVAAGASATRPVPRTAAARRRAASRSSMSR